MKTKLFFAVLLSLILSFSVSGQSGSKDKTICNLNQVGKTETLPLSSLVENCSFIQLEDKDDALFKLWFTTVTDKYIGVRQEGQKPFKLFDRKGKFLCNVGAVGQGPGEYAVSIYDEIIDDKNGLIYLAPFVGDKIWIYNTSGKFVKEFKAPLKLHKPKIHLSENGVLSVLHMPFQGDKAMVIQFDSKGNIIKQLAPPAEFVVENFNGEIFNTRNTSAFEFLHTSSEDLCHYNVKENKIEPVYTIAVNGSEKPFRQYMELKNMYVTNVWGKGVVRTDKKTGKSDFIKVQNDLYGGLEVPISVLTFRNGYFVHNLEPGVLKENIEKRMKESSCTAQDKQKLKKLLSSFDEEANNVLFIGKLK